MLDEALWVPGTSCAILAHKRETVNKIFEIVKRAYENLPEELKPVTRTDTKQAYDFVKAFDGAKLDSSIYVALKIRGGTVQNLHITESAYIEDRQELNAGSKQAVPITGRISEETTGNGFNEFYDFFMRYDNKVPGPMDYKTHFYPWFENPEYTLPGELPAQTLESIAKYGNEETVMNTYKLTQEQMLWRRWKIEELLSESSGEGIGLSGTQLFMQEYPATKEEAFQSGVGAVFNPELTQLLKPAMPIGLPKCVETFKDNPEQLGRVQTLFNAGVKFWHLPEFGKKYVVGVDPSGGDGADFACIDVWDKPQRIEDPIKQVAQFYVKLRPDELAEWTKEIALLYNKAFVGVENNMLSTILFLSKIYDDYYSQVTVDEKTQRRTKKIGWSTNTKTRDIMIDDYIILFEEGNLEINSAVTISEMRTFVKKDNGKREHVDGKHDDALFAAFIAIQMRKYERPLARASMKPSGL